MFGFGKRTVYFIDSENVNEKWIDEFPELDKNDQIKVFYTDKSANISPAKLDKILSDSINLKWVECFTGKNALDFQLVSDLGYSIGRRSNDSYVIVSNDKGYEAVVNYWVIKGIDVTRLEVDMGSDKPFKKYKKRSLRKQTPRVKSSASPVKKDVQKNTTKQVKRDVVKDNTNSVKKDTVKKNTSPVKKDTVKKNASPVKKDTVKNSTNSVKEVKNSTKAVKKEASKPNNNMVRSVWKQNPTHKNEEVEFVEAIGRSVPVSELGNYHVALTNLLGQELGTKKYHELKEDKVLKDKIGKTYISNGYQRLDYLTRTFLCYNNKGFEDLAAILGILTNKKSRDLNDFYRRLAEQFGENKGREYYNILKGVFKLLKEIQ